MNKYVLYTAILMSISSAANSQSIDVSSLSEYEQKVHRAGWCAELASQMINGDLPKVEYRKTWKVYDLLDSNKFFEEDWSGSMVQHRVRSDLRAEVLLGKVFTEEEAKQCTEDMMALLKNEYVPNFAYMK